MKNYRLVTELNGTPLCHGTYDQCHFVLSAMVRYGIREDKLLIEAEDNECCLCHKTKAASDMRLNVGDNPICRDCW